MNKNQYMSLALKEAQKAYDVGEVPIGAVIVKDGKVIARGHNLVETKHDPTMHAEMIAIRKASKKLGAWRLLDCEMYVTVEPCSMCTGAIIWSRLKKIYIGADDPRAGACGSVVNLIKEENLVYDVEIEKGIMADECAALMKDFFKRLRERKTEE